MPALLTVLATSPQGLTEEPGSPRAWPEDVPSRVSCSHCARAPRRAGAVLVPGPAAPRLIVAGEGQGSEADEPQSCLSSWRHAPRFPTTADAEARSSGLRPLQPGKRGGHGRAWPSWRPRLLTPSLFTGLLFLHSARCGLSPRAGLQGRDPTVCRQRAGVERPARVDPGALSAAWPGW